MPRQLTLLLIFWGDHLKLEGNATRWFTKCVWTMEDNLLISRQPRTHQVSAILVCFFDQVSDFRGDTGAKGKERVVRYDGID